MSIIDSENKQLSHRPNVKNDVKIRQNAYEPED